MIPVISFNIHSIGWENEMLRIKFKNGDIYEYEDVTEDEYWHFKNADSIGGYYYIHIKGEYKGIKLN